MSRSESSIAPTAQCVCAHVSWPATRTGLTQQQATAEQRSTRAAPPTHLGPGNAEPDQVGGDIPLQAPAALSLDSASRGSQMQASQTSDFPSLSGMPEGCALPPHSRSQERLVTPGHQVAPANPGIQQRCRRNRSVAWRLCRASANKHDWSVASLGAKGDVDWLRQAPHATNGLALTSRPLDLGTHLGVEWANNIEHDESPARRLMPPTSGTPESSSQSRCPWRVTPERQRYVESMVFS